jgi:hypothetical protein
MQGRAIAVNATSGDIVELCAKARDIQRVIVRVVLDGCPCAT